MKHFLNTLALTFIAFSGRFVFAMQKHYLFFCERSSSYFHIIISGKFHEILQVLGLYSWIVKSLGQIYVYTVIYVYKKK